MLFRSYVFSALGFYPVCPGADQYALGTPLFGKTVVHLENGKDITLTAKDVCSGPYIKSMKVNGKTWTHNYVDFNDLMNGADIEFVLSAIPEYGRGTAEEDKPYSYSTTL